MNSDAPPAPTPRILVVDDDLNLRQTLQRTLRRSQLHVDAAASAPLAWDHLTREHYDVLCADYHMPGPSGINLLERCSQQFPFMYRVLLTGGATLEIVLEAINSGQVHAVLRKPVAGEQLLRVLRRGVDHARTQRLARALMERCRRQEAQLNALGAAPHIARPEDDDYLPSQLPDRFEHLLALTPSSEDQP